MKIKLSPSWYFLISMVVVYFLLFFVRKDLFFISILLFCRIILRIVPALTFVFVLMAITNYFVTPKLVIKHLKKKRAKKWIIIILGGILSTGPIYIWYPLLADLRKKGLSYGLIACFLYNRAIKIPLLPLAIFYFGLKYVLVLSFTMVFISVIQGILIDRVMKIENKVEVQK